jgi:hypothetical protein
MAINQDMKAIVPGPKLGSGILFYALEALRDNLFKKLGCSAHGTATLMRHEVTSLQISLPDIKPSKEITKAISSADAKPHASNPSPIALPDLFWSTLNDSMTPGLSATFYSTNHEN